MREGAFWRNCEVYPMNEEPCLIRIMSADANK